MVSTFFEVGDHTTIKDSYVAQLRGREIVGQDVTLPDNVSGAVLVKHGGNGTSLECSYIVSALVDKVVVWEHDRAPQSGDFADYLDWFELANAVR